jgi:shikimate kinase
LGEKSIPENICLIGFRGSGKSSLGHALAQKLQVPFIDLDAEIERSVGRSINCIFAEEGEVSFRAYEARSLAQISASLRHVVIATGGGIVELPQNRVILHEDNFCIYLAASEAVLVGRIKAQQSEGGFVRPPLTDLPLEEEVHEVLTRRLPLYRAAAQLEVSVANSFISESLNILVEALQMGGLPWVRARLTENFKPSQ